MPFAGHQLPKSRLGDVWAREEDAGISGISGIRVDGRRRTTFSLGAVELFTANSAQKKTKKTKTKNSHVLGSTSRVIDQQSEQKENETHLLPSSFRVDSAGNVAL